MTTENGHDQNINGNGTSLNDNHSVEEEEGLNLTEDVADPYCNPDCPQVINFNDVSAAAYKIKGGIEKTPCSLSQMSKQYDMQIYFKKDFLQYTGSFKERGARYVLSQLTQSQAKKGVIAASAGNHALALAYHGRLLNVPVTVVMPLSAPMMKVEACKQQGSTVVVTGLDFGEAKRYAMALGKKRGLLYVNGYDHPHIVAGQGTMGLEIIEQVPHLDACIIPVGGGGLIAGSAIALKALKPGVEIIGVESERSTGFQAAMAAGHPIMSHVGQTLADGLAVPVVGCNSLATAEGHIDKMVTVRESYIALAILRLIEQEKAVVEGAGAAGLAAIIEGLVPELKGKTVVVALCGGNIDTTALGRVIERGLAAEGRLVRFGVTVSDRPGGIAELAKRIADQGVSIKDILHERAWLQTDVFSVMVRCVVETRDMEHARQLEREMRKHYGHVEFCLDKTAV
ncbi:L-threonine ammonia-lyase-like [Plakobranchus ocellatus]|uniref:L-serine deaminase n=1 Tax=Plakobranchus ocellatus TaxID=259542 RepID=A0AAV3Y5B5_9GAST|nr:L-threonine ammonia-lyase-like [Plakobranchus ocellatus]